MATFQLTGVDLQRFSKALSACTGGVYLVTSDGDRLNLKSKLCELVGVASLLNGHDLTNAHLECSEPGDAAHFTSFLKN